MLLIVAANDEQVAGRTVLQKLAYFCALELGYGLHHRAHFFGPYSARVEDAVENAVVAGQLREVEERMRDWFGGPDARRYTYFLEEAGRRRVDDLKKQSPKQWTRICSAVTAIRSALPSLDQQTLSSAAKTHLLISENDEGVDEDELPVLARRLGWDLSAEQVALTVKILDELGLLEEEPARI
ncbi:hypothetical protein HJD18_01420 [Thermoleophilia bacterium SCSIO 60948]|nr:hypothetical protein HJD18_01420 [Thermoleophilia bacterium SCSIO 60948]